MGSGFLREGRKVKAPAGVSFVEVGWVGERELCRQPQKSFSNILHKPRLSLSWNNLGRFFF